MHLINVQTHKLEKFETISPPYAILSHRWRDDEVSFQDFQNITKREMKMGFAKILDICTLAKSDGLEWVWVDTCCIDKSSSSELSEAINSMFKWYRRSAVCYAYLDDVYSLDGEQYFDHVCTVPDSEGSKTKKSEWFERGWTLQELIAPRKLKFYDSGWNYLGSKKNLASRLSQITNIDADLLRRKASLEQFSVARRMSWAAERKTTREEDIAYCLLGLFNVNMPMLYGEGSKAFLRLQEEITRAIDDHTIFAWKEPSATSVYRGMFASSPKAFGSTKDQIPMWSITMANHIEVTARGLRTKATVCPKSEVEAELKGPSNSSYLLLPLNCSSLKHGGSLGRFGAVLLVWRSGNRYLRALPHKIFEVREDQISRDTTIYIAKDEVVSTSLPEYVPPPTISCLFFVQLPDEGTALLDASPINAEYKHSHSMLRVTGVPDPSELLRTGSNFLCGLAFDVGDGQVILIMIELSNLSSLSHSSGHRTIGHKMVPRLIGYEVSESGLTKACKLELERYGSTPEHADPSSFNDSIVTQDISVPKPTKPTTDCLRVSLKSISTEPLFYMIRLSFIQSRSWYSKA